MVAAYDVDGRVNVEEAERVGITALVRQWSVGSQPRYPTIDTYVKNRLYATYCPRGRASCAAPGQEQLDRMSHDISQHVETARPAGEVVGYILTDDFWYDMRIGLEQAREAIRTADPSAPSVCQLEVPLEPARTGVADDPLGQSLRNYSPVWCDAVAIYSYRRPLASNQVREPIDWSLENQLRDALPRLSASGWDKDEHPLIGIVQAFGYTPRTSTGSQPLPTPQTIPSPTAIELSTQVAGFCRHGAAGIIAYAWEDSSRGNVSTLSTSAELRAGLKNGLGSCRNKWDR